MARAVIPENALLIATAVSDNPLFIYLEKIVNSEEQSIQEMEKVVFTDLHFP